MAGVVNTDSTTGDLPLGHTSTRLPFFFPPATKVIVAWFQKNVKRIEEFNWMGGSLLRNSREFGDDADRSKAHGLLAEDHFPKLRRL
jgi:hypothetical protein